MNGASPVRSRQLDPSPAHHAQEDGTHTSMRTSTESTKKQVPGPSKTNKRERDFNNEEEKEAYNRRLLSNRRAAQASRQRKKFLIEDLNKTVNTLTEEKQQLKELNSELRRQLQESRQEQDRLSNLLTCRRSTSLTHTHSSPSLGTLSSAQLSSLLGSPSVQAAQLSVHLGSSAAGLIIPSNGTMSYLPSIASQMLSLPSIVQPTTSNATLNVNDLLLQQQLQQRLQEALPSTTSIVSTNYQQGPPPGVIHQAQQALQLYQSKHLSASTSPSPDNGGKKETSAGCKMEKKSAPSA